MRVAARVAAEVAGSPGDRPQASLDGRVVSEHLVLGAEGAVEIQLRVAARSDLRPGLAILESQPELSNQGPNPRVVGVDELPTVLRHLAVREPARGPAPPANPVRARLVHGHLHTALVETVRAGQAGQAAAHDGDRAGLGAAAGRQRPGEKRRASQGGAAGHELPSGQPGSAGDAPRSGCASRKHTTGPLGPR